MFQISVSNIIPIVIALVIGGIAGAVYTFIALKDEEEKNKKSSLRFQRSVLGGKFSEHFAPYLPSFPADLKASEAKFMGDPVDFIVFKGLDEKNITKVVFVEVKSGRAGFNHNEKSLKDAIDNKRVRYIPYRVPEDITKFGV